ncbi:extracellular solute-binding protein [candidate division KSB1 bacterium]|nr:extracellular solute-binding protein [candidate division KSB1 bacterium]
MKIKYLIFIIIILLNCANHETAQTVLNFAYPTPGDRYFKLMSEVIDEFETLHPGVEIRQNVMHGDIYQDFGLLTLFQSGQAPDLYGQWGGWLVRRDAKFGFAADITEALDSLSYNGQPWRERFMPAAWSGMTYEGRNFAVATSVSVTNAIWYNKDMFDKFNLREPRNWEEFMHICRTLKSNGIVPISQGNKGVWPMGNWVAHVVSRVSGEAAFNDVMTLEDGTCFANPDFIRAFGLFEEMAQQEFFNPGMSGRSDLEGMMYFLNGHSAMHPIGSWLINRAIDEAARLNYDAFNTPRIPDSKGDSTSIIGVTFGYLVGKNTQHFDLAVEFLEYLTRPEIQKRFVDIGSLCSVKEAIDALNVEPHIRRMTRMVQQANVIVPPPDTGFKLDVSDAFNDAVALVVGGEMDAARALEQADRVVRRLRQ